MGGYYVVSTFARLLISGLTLAMVLRMILSWFVEDEDNLLLVFVFGLTEPLIEPLRRLFDRFEWFQDTPIDMPAFTACMILSLLGLIL